MGKKANSSFKLYCKSLLACWMAFSCSRWLSLSGLQIGHWLINANLKCFLRWGGGQYGHAILVHVRRRKFYGGWLTQRPTAYLPSDKNAHSQTYQDKSIIPWFTVPWVPLCKENYSCSPLDGDRIIANRARILLVYIIFPTAPSSVEVISFGLFVPNLSKQTFC